MTRTRVARVLDRERTGEARDRGFERGVHGASRDRAERFDRRDVDDAAAVALLDEPRQHRPRAREHVREVDAIEVVPFRVGLFVERGPATAEVTDVVDEHVDPAEVVAGRGDERFRRSVVAHVAHDADDALPDRHLRLAGTLGVDLGEHHRRTLRGEALDDVRGRCRHRHR